MRSVGRVMIFIEEEREGEEWMEERERGRVSHLSYGG